MTTDESIEKGLECCAGKDNSGCLRCPYRALKSESGACTRELSQNALSYINYLKSKLENAEESFTKLEELYKEKCKIER